MHGHNGHARIMIWVCGFTSIHHSQSWEIDFGQWQGVLDTTLCDQVSQ